MFDLSVERLIKAEKTEEVEKIIEAVFEYE